MQAEPIPAYCKIVGFAFHNMMLVKIGMRMVNLETAEDIAAPLEANKGIIKMNARKKKTPLSPPRIKAGPIVIVSAPFGIERIASTALKI
tara:strand:+ start:13763 stop:14032 length:270 start_codon:yes stop_codon:yes gene_type:complete